RARTRIDTHYSRAKQLHAIHVRSLTTHVLAAHVHHTLEAVSGRYRRRCDTVLTSPGFGDDARLAHAPSQQYLANAIVDFMGARVVEIFALEPDLSAAQLLGPTASMVHRT